MEITLKFLWAGMKLVVVSKRAYLCGCTMCVPSSRFLHEILACSKLILDMLFTFLDFPVDCSGPKNGVSDSKRERTVNTQA